MSKVLFLACCFSSDNLCGSWLVFIRECGFDNRENEGNAIEWRNISGLRENR